MQGEPGGVIRANQGRENTLRAELARSRDRVRQLSGMPRMAKQRRQLARVGKLEGAEARRREFLAPLAVDFYRI